MARTRPDPRARSSAPGAGAPTARRRAPDAVLAGLVAVSSAYALLADAPYRGIGEATAVAARAQDVCSVLVAALLLGLARSPSSRSHLLRLGLYAYLAYSYAVYLIGLPMNRVFLVYVVLVGLSGALLLDGLVRLRPEGWAQARRHGLERATGWLFVVVAVGFAALWLSVLVPYALGGAEPRPQGPGGAAYPVFVLDLVVALPCVAAVGALLLRGRQIGVPLAVVVLVKILTLFLALWAGVVVGWARGVEVHLGADAGPSLLMLVACGWLLRRWLQLPQPEAGTFLRARVWS